MLRRTVGLAIGLSFVFSLLLFASHDRGIDARVTLGANGVVVLSWTGGQPRWTIYRSQDKTSVVAPANEIGVTPETTFSDNPPPATIWYYEITSCPADPRVEECNGFDDNCNGVVDEAAACFGNGASCGTGLDCISGFCVDGICCQDPCIFPNAGTSCGTGICQIDTCNQGFANCNGDVQDGCEIDVTSDPAHCGGCQTSCDDASSCTNDLCASGSCRNVDRAQCAAPACGFAQAYPGCPAPDTDGDGLGDVWEDAQKIDLDCNGVYDANDVSIPDANKYVSDVYLKISWMGNSPSEPDPNTHKPDPSAIDRVVAAFGGAHVSSVPTSCDADPLVCPAGFACSSGDRVCLPVCTSDADCAAGHCVDGVCRKWRLHVEVDTSPIPHYDVVSFGTVHPACLTGGDLSRGVNFYDLKSNPSNFDKKTALFKHYLVFGHNNTCDSTATCGDPNCLAPDGSQPTQGTSGIAEVRGNDSIVSLAAFPVAVAPDLRISQESGAILHELGHNLGLYHGGPCNPPGDPTCADNGAAPKVNYISVMNPRYNFGIPVADWPGSVTPNPIRTRIDYSRKFLPLIDEAALSEPAGLQPGNPPPFDTDLVRFYTPAAGGQTRFGSTAPGQPINWKTDDPIVSTPVQADINGSGLLEQSSGAQDWDFLRYDFQCSATFADGAPPPPGSLTGHELAPLEAAQLDVLHPLQVPTLDVQRVCIDLDSHEVIPAILYGSAGFNVQQINLITLMVAEAPPQSTSMADLDNDGRLDLKAQVRQSDMVLSPGNALAVVTGKMLDGASLQGEDVVQVAGPGQTCPSGCAVDCATLFCTIGSTCVDGVCAGGAPRDCSDGLACSLDTCNEQTDQCVHQAATTELFATPVAPGPATTPVKDPGPISAGSSQYFGKGSVLYALRNLDEGALPAGSIRWQTSFPTTLQNFPAPVPLSNEPGQFLYVTGDNGTLYKVRTQDAGPGAPAGGVVWGVDLRRSTCSGDKLAGTPAIQIYRFSNSTFQSAQDARGLTNHDLVFVVTRAGCGTHSDNRVLAIDASTGAAVWTFNNDRTRWVDAGTEGCTVDYQTNTLYCGTDLEDGRAQNTLWAIDSTSAAVKWATNAGPILNRPMLNYGPTGPRLYVANGAGGVMAYNPAGDGAGGAARLWASPVVLGGGVSQNFFAEFQPGTNRVYILAVDDSGAATAVFDDGTYGTTLWKRSAGPGLKYKGMAVVAPSSGKVFVGRSDGYLQQVDLQDGSPDNVAAVSPDTIYNPGLGLAPTSTDVDLVTIAAGTTSGVVKGYCAPWPDAGLGYCAGDADCAAMSGACVVAACDVAHGVCVLAARPEGTPCDDGLSCSFNEVCRAGACLSDDYSLCPCVKSGDRACAAGQTCCGSAAGGTCTDVDLDPQNCGACNRACAPGQTCVEGACVRDTSAACPGGWTDPADLTALAPTLAGAVGVTYDRTSQGVCNAYVSTYRNPPTQSGVVRVHPSGTASGSWSNPDPQITPLGGFCDLTSDSGDWMVCGAINRPAPAQDLPGLMVTGTSVGFNQIAFQGSRTSSTTPFLDQRLDQGPVGPVVERKDNLQPGQVDAYVANWRASGDLYVLVQQSATGPKFELQVPGWTSIPQRITALAFGKSPAGGVPVHRFLYIGYGTKLSILDIDAAAVVSTIDLGNPDVYNGAVGGGLVSAIRSLTADPLYGDLYIEVNDTGGRAEMLLLREDDYSVHNLFNVSVDLHLQPFAPAQFSNQGRLVLTPSGQLLRLTPSPGGGAATYSAYKACP